MIDVIDRFIDQVINFPSEIAIIDEEEAISYKNLFYEVKKIAASILRIKKHPKVFIHLSQGKEAYASMLGVLYAGGYYCPVNTDLPVFRKQKIVEQFSPDVIISSPDHYSYLKEVAPNARFINVQSIEEGIDPDTEQGEPFELAYVIFTSGSTGNPKGVMIRRRSLSKFLSWSIKETRVKNGDRWGQFSNLGFDLSIVDIYTSLCSGATLVAIKSPKDRLMPATAIQKYKLTIWHSVPSVLDLAKRANQINLEMLRSIRLMSFCGEPLYPQHLDWLFDAKPDIEIFNTYGPTEGTLFCTWIPLNKQNYKLACDATVAIGKPIPGWNIYISDIDNGIYTNGEAIIYGDYIGVGYWNDPQKSAEVYKDILLDKETYPAYFTGDIIEVKNNHLFFKKRIDNQVKIHGFRVELNEIDFYIRSFGIPNCKSILHNEKIYSFLETDNEFIENDLRDFLQKRLPYYELPSFFIEISVLPRNPNSKIDIKKLKSLIKN